MVKLWRKRFVRRLGMALAGLLVASTLTGCLGWFAQFATTDGSSLNGIACPSATVCFAVGATATRIALVEQTTDAGGRWVSDTTGVSGAALNAISCANPDHCVAVGDSNTALVTNDGGVTWKATTISPIAVDGSVTSVSCPDTQNCWVTTEQGDLAASADGGVTWTALRWTLPPYGLFTGAAVLKVIACPTASACVAIGQIKYVTNPPPESTTPSFLDYSGVVVTTNDGGQTWQSQLVSDSDLVGVSCPVAQDCVAVGPQSAFQVVTAGTPTWTVSTLAAHVFDAHSAPSPNAVSCFDSAHCVAIGDVSGKDQKYVTPAIATSDGGRTWSNEAVSPSDGTLKAAACVTVSSCWAAGASANGALIVHTINGGVAVPSITSVDPGQGPASGGTFVKITGDGFSTGVTKVSFGDSSTTDFTVDSDSELTVTVPPFPGGPVATMDVTVTTALGGSPPRIADQFTYFGASQAMWSKPTLADPTRSSLSVSCVTASFCELVDYLGNVLTWDGGSWSAPLLIDAGGDISSVSCPTATFCMAVDGSGNALTRNGDTWSAPTQIETNMGNPRLTSVSCPTVSFCGAVSEAGDALTWNGISWLKASLANGGGIGLTSVSCPSASFCAAVGSLGNQYSLLYTWNGGSWSNASNIDQVGGINSISCPTATFCMAVDLSGNALTWNGDTWSAPTQIDGSANLGSVSCTSPSFCITADYSGNALIWNGIAWVEPSDIVDPGNNIRSVSCPSASFCIAIDGPGNALIYLNPFGT